MGNSSTKETIELEKIDIKEHIKTIICHECKGKKYIYKSDYLAQFDHPLFRDPCETCNETGYVTEKVEYVDYKENK